MVKAFNSHRIPLVDRQVLRFNFSEVKTLKSCSLKAPTSCFLKQNNCPSFGNKSTLSHIPTELKMFLLIYKVQNCRVPVSIKQGLQTVNCRLGIKHRVRYKVQTEHYKLGINHRVWYKM